jgi:hypothetical protein
MAHTCTEYAMGHTFTGNTTCGHTHQSAKQSLTHASCTTLLWEHHYYVPCATCYYHYLLLPCQYTSATATTTMSRNWYNIPLRTQILLPSRWYHYYFTCWLSLGRWTNVFDDLILIAQKRTQSKYFNSIWMFELEELKGITRTNMNQWSTFNSTKLNQRLDSNCIVTNQPNQLDHQLNPFNPNP